MITNSFLSNGLPNPLIDLKQKICTSVDPFKFFSEEVYSFSFIQNQRCPFPDHEDTTPSFRGREDGSFKCFGCGKGGSNIIQFYMYKYKVEYKEALQALYNKYITKILTKDALKVYKKNLSHEATAIEFLKLTRGWSDEIINFLDLGYSMLDNIPFITIPVKDEYGFYVSVLFYNFTHNKDKPKFLMLQDGDNSPRIFGLECIKASKKIYIFEGQPDWILALSLGLPAITFGSASNWKDSFGRILEGYDIVIVYDNDDAGKKGADNIANRLALSAKSIKIVKLPLKDFSDFLKNVNFELGHFSALEDSAEYYKIDEVKPPKIDTIPESSIELSTLSKAALADNYNKKLRLVALVAGKEPSPLLVPRKLQITCKDKPNATKCESCILAKSPKLSQIFDVDSYMKDILKWVVPSSKDFNRTYKETLGVNTKCRTDIVVEKMFNVEKVILNNPVRHGRYNELPERRLGFFFGHGLVPNRHYTLDLYSTQHPNDNSVVHIILHSDPLDTEIENATFKPTDLNELRAFTTTDIQKKFDEIYEILSRNVTKIWGRPTLHLALDLPFFSPNEFMFAGDYLKKAALDVIVFGDQRCGKGKIAEGLSDFYKFAEVLSGENTSFMNLVGGIEANDSYRGLKWGRIVANNGGVIIIDEASALETSTIAKLSRIRSEGLAELDKYGIHAKAIARCGFIWLSNTRTDPLSKFNFGIEALKELIGQPEDIARFDYAVAVRANEVDSDVINKITSPISDPYGPNLHRLLILWCKTRKVDQVKFTDEAIDLIHTFAKELGHEYTSDIPLIQSENIRIKLAKISAAIAGRVFSTDSEGENLIIDSVHVRAAVDFLRSIYHDSPIAYKDYSNMVLMAQDVNENNLDALLEPIERIKLLRSFLEAMLTMKEITLFDFQDILGVDMYEARRILGGLTREGALSKEGRFYRKSPKFIDYIKAKLTRVNSH